ncbi:MAG: SIS domain-containing protein [Deltaproteobacteria bacterium]|nr:SIS domain-containing protein [Deltaproteobacteria bacterium]
MANRLDELFAAEGSASVFARGYSRYLSELLQALDGSAVAAVAECLLQARSHGRTVFFAGNGGSAATASHFAQDLAAVGQKAGVAGFRSLSLTDHTARLTAVANDSGYAHIFTAQMDGLFQAGDVLVAISASGESPNVVAAVQWAKARQGVTIGFVGFTGGTLAQCCDHVLHVRTAPGEYGPVEDVHLAVEHMITGYLALRLRQEKEAV